MNAPVPEITTQGAYDLDTWIETVQHTWVYVDNHADAQRWIAYLTETLGYSVMGGPMRCEGRWRVDFVITRDTVADSRRDDAVAVDGRYEVKRA